MKNLLHTDPEVRLTLRAATAADLMTPNPVSIREDAVVREAVTFLTDTGFSAAPVIDEAGRPVGVISRSDIVVHDRETAAYAPTVPDYYDGTDPVAPAHDAVPRGFQVETVDRTRVRDIMTPVVFAVAPDTPADKVLEDMLGLNVHRLFVVAEDGVLTGVISALDLLRHLRPE